MKKTIAILGFCWYLIFAFLNSAWAESEGELFLTAPQVKFPEVQLYMDIINEHGTPVSDVVTDQLSATIGNTEVVVKDVTPFSRCGESTSYILLVDVSQSMEKHFNSMRAVLNGFVEQLEAGERVCLITFGNEVQQIQGFTDNLELLKTNISLLKPTDEKTRLHQGLLQALEIVQSQPGRNVILALSDGQEDFPGDVTGEEVLSRFQKSPLPVYSVGYFNSTQYPVQEDHLNSIKELASISGGQYLEATLSPGEITTAIRDRVHQGYRLRLDCSPVSEAGELHTVEVSYSAAATTINDRIEVPFLATPDAGTKQATEEGTSIWWYIGGGSLGLVILLFLIFTLKKTKEKPTTSELTLESTIHVVSEHKPLQVVKPVIPKNSLKIRLVLMDHSQPGIRFEANLTNHLIIGKKKADIDLTALHDNEIAEQHGEIFLEQDMVMLRQLDMRRSLLVNGVPITGNYRIKNKDVILIGRTELRFLVVDESSTRGI